MSVKIVKFPLKWNLCIKSSVSLFISDQLFLVLLLLFLANFHKEILQETIFTFC